MKRAMSEWMNASDKQAFIPSLTISPTHTIIHWFIDFFIHFFSRLPSPTHPFVRSFVDSFIQFHSFARMLARMHAPEDANPWS